MTRACLLLALAALPALIAAAPLQAQKPRFGFAVGAGFVGGARSKTLVDINGDTVTGADEAGLHLRGYAEVPFRSPAFAFRGEVFFNRMTSASNSWAVVGESLGKAALLDQTMGVSGTFTGMMNSNATVSLYFLVGAGIFASKLGTNNDPQSTEVVATKSGVGLGLQGGMGLRWRTGPRDLLLEWRYAQALNDTRGAAFMPLTVGFTIPGTRRAAQQPPAAQQLPAPDSAPLRSTGHFYVAGGVEFAQLTGYPSSYADSYGPGMGYSVHAGWTTHTQVWGVRAGLAYYDRERQYGSDVFPDPANQYTTSARTIGLNWDVSYDFTPWRVRPYLIAGLVGYWVHTTDYFNTGTVVDEHDIGVAITPGAGVRVPLGRTDLFTELRWYYGSGTSHVYMPLTIGVQF